MILTPIPREQLEHALDRFSVGLGDPFSRAVFGRIRATSPDRAAGAAAERHRHAALSLARAFGMVIHPEGTQSLYNWDGMALNGATEAYVILHEVAHFALAPPERRGLIEFGLGPGPDTVDREAALRAAALSPLAREKDEAVASLLGILWEAELGQPALASFLDQNWLEGLDRSAASHFASVLGSLRLRGLLTPASPGGCDKALTARGRRADQATNAERGCVPDPGHERPRDRNLQPMRRFVRPASNPAHAGPGDNPTPPGDCPDLPIASPRWSGIRKTPDG
jgi:hypothetical protein